MASTPVPQGPSPDVSANSPRITTRRAHFLIAGLGASIPAVCQIMVVDNPDFLDPTLGNWIGFFVKVLFSFIIGGIITHYLYWDETHPGKLFGSGLAAPAMFFALANGNQAKKNPRPPVPHAQQQGSPQLSGNPGKSPSFFLWTVHADNSQYRTFSLPGDSFVQQVIRGVTGDPPRNVYFAIAGSYSTSAWAELNLKRIKQNYYSSAEIYGPSAGNQYYSIVIASQVPLEYARAKVTDALRQDLMDAYAWRYGDPGVLPGAPSWADQLGRTDYLDTALGAGFGKALRETSREALIQLGDQGVQLLGDILRNSYSRVGRDQDLLMNEVASAIKEWKGVTLPPNILASIAAYYAKNLKDCNTAEVFYGRVDPKTLAAEPDHYCALGACRFNANNFEAAKDAYGLCTEIKGNDASQLDRRQYGKTLVELGKNYERANRDAEARIAFQQGLKQINLARKLGDDPRVTRVEFERATDSLARLPQ